LKVAVTGAAGFLGRALLPKLSANHQVLATDLVAHQGDTPIEPCDVLDVDAVSRLCSEVDAIVHLAAATYSKDGSKRENETQVFDTRLKGTHNLLESALRSGVQRVIQISDLCVFAGYDDGLMVSEDFVPLPHSEAYPLSVYLSELVGREYARLAPGLVLTLRLGKLIDTGSLAADAQFEDGWLDIGDAVDAILRGLELERFAGMGDWGIYNLAANVPDNRYSLLKIQSPEFGFFPRQDFAAWRKT